MTRIYVVSATRPQGAHTTHEAALAAAERASMGVWPVTVDDPGAEQYDPRAVAMQLFSSASVEDIAAGGGHPATTADECPRGQPDKDGKRPPHRWVPGDLHAGGERCIMCGARP